MPYLIKPSLKDYSWGDIKYIQELIGALDMTGKPLAEAWFGAHPQSPSLIITEEGEIPMDKLLETYPESMLGKNQGNNLPFLFKILAAAQPLSLQVHPDRQTAQYGFQKEEEARIPITDPNRIFKDPNPKPELICALTPFIAMCGFRPYEEIIRNFQILGIDNLWPALSSFQTKPCSKNLQELFNHILTSEPSQLETTLSAMENCKNNISPKFRFTCQICKHLNEFYPQDSGVLSPLLLNTFTLQPGQAIFLEPGILHSYIQGAGIEIMANSDNVIRGGLTPKHIDRDILFAITRFETYLPKLLHPHLKLNELVPYPNPAEEFHLYRLILEGNYILTNQYKPMLVFCFRGSLNTESGLSLQRGKAMFIPSEEKMLQISGSADLFIASTY
ncbi:MAG TPA: mannose-6-phosphate isomerase, class I [Candidatus Cloacimonas sp.]|nr:mannose-6-phosphate isomerase, class I [Candidatus Cloacimonas sp.]